MRDCETCKHYVAVKNRHSGEITKSCECWECNYKRGMTESEAIKEVRFNMSTIGLNNGAAKRVVESRNMAIKALEKQIPKKVNLRHIRKYDGYDDGECPNCGMSVSREFDGNDVFCPECGQKLNWESDEE